MNNWLIIAAYLTCFASTGLYLYKKVKYSGVESWPSVPAYDVGEQKVSGSLRADSYTGTKVQHTSYSIVSYQYIVDGRDYEGTVSSPDGDSLPLNLNYEAFDSDGSKLKEGASIPMRPIPKRWRAYYNPDEPAVAVLDPVPFRGIGYLWVVGFTGIMVVWHIYFTFRQYRLAPNRADKEQ